MVSRHGQRKFDYPERSETIRHLLTVQYITGFIYLSCLWYHILCIDNKVSSSMNMQVSASLSLSAEETAVSIQMSLN